MRREYGFTLVKVKHVSSGKTWIWKLAKKITQDPRVEKPGSVNFPPQKRQLRGAAATRTAM